MTIINSTVNAVAMTVLPDAPFDVATGIQIPTIAVFTAGGISVIQDIGTVVNSLSTATFTKGLVDGDEVSGVSSAGVLVSSSPRSLVAGFTMTIYSTTSVPALMGVPIVMSGNKATKEFANATGVTIIKENLGTPAKGISARIANTFNTGHLFSDCRRAYLCNTEVESVSNPTTVLDRSYKAAGASIVGTLTKTPVAAAAQLVAFSGFSAANYIQEPYSADLDFGVGEFSVGAWVSSTGYGPSNLCTQSDGALGSYVQSNVVAAVPISGFTNSQSVQLSANGTYCYKSLATTLGLPHCLSVYVQMDDNGIPNPSTVNTAGYDFTMVMFGGAGFTPTVTAIGGGVYRVSVTGVAVAGSNFGVVKYGGQTSRGFKVTGYQIELGYFPKTYRSTTASAFNGVAPIAERAAATGPNFVLGLDGTGKLVATVFDGTTTRTVTTSSTYNTGISTKATANYTAVGKLAINVNGVEALAVTGTPLLNLNNPAAVLTIGNNRTLDAPFPGSITMLKLGATVPTPEQEMWMYEQEKQMFRDGAQITLPDTTPVLDLSYDESQDKWVALQAGRESSFTGLIRTASATPNVGSFTKVVASSGIKALARNATNPGVDIQIPAFGLREELVKRSEAAAKASKTLTVFDFDSVAGQTDFVLPIGWKTSSVVSAGNTQREGSTKNFIRLFDGFRETIRFAVAPGAGVWIRINAVKE